MSADKKPTQKQSHVVEIINLDETVAQPIL